MKQRFNVSYAGPGCGKTELLLDEYKKDERRKCLVTFSRKTAQELRNRSGLNNARTFHSLAYTLVKKLYPHSIIVPHKINTSSCLSFDDIMNIAAEEVDLIAERFDSIYIDEYQDVDSSQLRLIKGLLDRGLDIIAVGDPNQSIYGFRNKNVKPFEKAIEWGAVVKTGSTESYRIPISVAAAANNLIRYNNPTVGSKISSISKDKTPVYIWNPKNDSRKAEMVKEELSKTKGTSLVLFRTNNEASYFLNLPVFEGITVKMTFADTSQVAQNSASILLQLYDACINDPIIIRKLLSSNISEADIGHICAFIEMKTKNIRSLISMLELTGQTHIAEVLYPFEELTTQQAIHAIDDIPVRYDAVLANNCRVMTIHGSKGLEADTVFLDMNSAFMPISTSDIEEERRLAYVGITRAKKKLVIMYSSTTMESTLLPVVGGPSSFVKEAFQIS